MDIWIAIQKENAEKLVAVLKEFGFDIPHLAADLFLKENQIIRMGNPPMRIELLTTISGVRFEECYSERTIDVIDDVEVQIINLEHLKRNKRVSGRQKDSSLNSNLESKPRKEKDSHPHKLLIIIHVLFRLKLT